MNLADKKQRTQLRVQMFGLEDIELRGYGPP